jgi:hypothetical protein
MVRIIIAVASCNDGGSYEQGPGLHLEPELIEKNVEEIRERVHNDRKYAFKEAKAEIEKESTEAWGRWKRDGTERHEEPGHDNDETIAIKSNGPVPPNCFVWNKEKYDGLPPVPWRLVDTLWKSPNHTAGYRTLGEPVWDDREIEPDKEAVGTARKAANRFFQAKGIPLKVAIKGLCVSLRNTSRE